MPKAQHLWLSELWLKPIAPLMRTWELLDAETQGVGRCCSFTCANSPPTSPRWESCHRFGKNPSIKQTVNVSRSFLSTLLGAVFSSAQGLRFPESFKLGLSVLSDAGHLSFITNHSHMRCGTRLLSFCGVYLWTFMLAGYSAFFVSTAMRFEVDKICF